MDLCNKKFYEKRRTRNKSKMVAKNQDGVIRVEIVTFESKIIKILFSAPFWILRSVFSGATLDYQQFA
jgi:hypothetical protein